MIMSILYERKDSPLLEESPIYMCVCVICNREKSNLPYKGYIGSFYSSWGPHFHGRGKGSHVIQISFSYKDKISLTHHSKMSLILSR